MNRKSTVAEIRERFDNDVERFSNLETGQSAAIDAPISLDLVARAAAATTPDARSLLDLGCGAGNFSLRTLALGQYERVTLVDLSHKMLDRATERVSATFDVTIESMQGDVRELEFATDSYDVVVAGAVLHHLRTDAEWRDTFAKIYRTLRRGGSFWIFDMVLSSLEPVRQLKDERYGAYLTAMKDEAYRDHVFDYIEKEDTPKPLMFQLDMLREVGFDEVDILHFNARFAAFGAVRNR